MAEDYQMLEELGSKIKNQLTATMPHLTVF